MRKIILLLISIIWCLSEAETGNIHFEIKYNSIDHKFHCYHDSMYVINENDVISLRVEVDAGVIPQACYNQQNSMVYFYTQSKYNNNGTGIQYNSYGVNVSFDLSFLWTCNIYYNTYYNQVKCDLPVHVRSSSIPKININDNILTLKIPDNTIHDYDAKVEYNFIEGDIIHISCIYNEPIGLKFIHNGFGKDNIYQPTDFIYGYALIYAWIRMKSSHNNSYIDCVVKRNEYRNAVVRVHLVLKHELANEGTIIIKINDKKLTTVPAKHSVTDYDAEGVYNFVEGELIRVNCIYNEATGMKFVYSCFGTDDVYQPTGFINGHTSIHSRITMKKSYDNTYINCVVKRNLTRNAAVVRVHLVKKDDLANNDELIIRVNGVRLTPREIPHNFYTYMYKPLETINISCESNTSAKRYLKLEYNPNMNVADVKTVASNFVSSFVDMAKYLNTRNDMFYAECSVGNSKVTVVLIDDVDQGVTVYGLKPSNILLQFRNEIDVDVILYEYEVKELLNLTWFLKSEGDTKRDVLIAWKGTVLEHSVLNTSLSETMVSHMVSLGSGDNSTIISCLVRKELDWNERIWIVLLLSQQQTSTNQNYSGFLSTGIPIIKINDEQLQTRQSNRSVTDYDSLIQYNFVEGELLRINCIYEKPTGMKFIYNGFGIGENNTYQATDYIYERTSIHSRVRVKSSHDNAYIDCVVKQNEYQNAVARVYLVNKNELANKDEIIVRVNGVRLMPRKAPHNVCTYIYMSREAVNISCESNSSIKRKLKLEYNTRMYIIDKTETSNSISNIVDMSKYMYTRDVRFNAVCSIVNSNTKVKVVLNKAFENGVTVYGLKPTNILMQFRNNVDVDIIFYEYEDNELLNLTWFLKPEDATKRDVRITWKDTVLNISVLKSGLKGALASYEFSLNAGDNWTVISCLVKKQLYWNKELRIVLLTQPQPFTDPNFSGSLSTGITLLIGLPCTVCTAFIIVTLLIIWKNKKNKKQLSETEVSNCDTIDDRVNRQFPKSLDGYVQSTATERHETTTVASNDPTCLYSIPIPKSERVVVNNDKSLYENVNDPCNKTYINAEIHLTNVRNGNGDNNYDKNVNINCEPYANINNDKDIEMELYSEVNLKS